MTDKIQLRSTLQARRIAVPAVTRAMNARNALRHLQAHPLFIHAETIAVYLAQNGELDPEPITQTAQRLGKTVLLPVLRPGKTLGFMPLKPGLTRLTPNRYGIPEPEWKPQFAVAAKDINLVLVPLVAVDRQGNRLGMGGGYYDRSFAFRQRKPMLQAPVLLGLAYEFQRVQKLPAESWDVPLAGTVTAGGVWLATAAREL